MVIYFGNHTLDFSMMKDCPICNSKMQNKRCKNKCFCDLGGAVSIFDEFYAADKYNEETIVIRVKYWKDNDRYLAKILSQNN